MDTVSGGRQEALEATVLRPLVRTGRVYWLVVGILLVVICWGLFAYITQLRDGLVVTGMRDRISWGLYITLFVFFIGISHAGTLISAILRVVQAQWRTPVTRMAEFITVVALSVGGLMPLIDMGHPDRVLNIVVFGRWQSPLVWDILAITTYLTGSIIYLYLPLIPDLALCRDRLGRSEAPAWKRQFYRIASVGWSGTPLQKKRLHLAMGLMMVLIIPVAVSVHTVVSWIFAMTLRDAWNSTVFGPYFVAGAIYSGVAALVLMMALLRRAFNLGAYITDRHFVNLGYILGGFTLIMLYFNLQEYVVTGYKMAGESSFHFLQVFAGEFAPVFWFYVLGGMVVPGLIILIPWTRTFSGVLVASALALAGMWVERWIIVVAGLRAPLMAYEPAQYAPTWVEWSIMAGAFALFGLVIAAIAKMVPVISVWEVAEQYEEASERESAPEAIAPPVLAPEGAARSRRASFLWIVPLALLSAVLWHAGSALAADPVSLTVQAPNQMGLGDEAVVTASLTDSQGRPIPGASIHLSVQGDFLSVKSAVELDRATTGAQGTARLRYQARTANAVTLTASFPGNSRYAPAQSSTDIAIEGSAQLYQQTEEVQFVGVGVWLLAGVLGVAWSTYFAVMVLVTLIARTAMPGAREMGDVHD